MKHRHSRINMVDLGIDLLESFKKITSWTNDQFLEYMNANNNWDILNDESIIRGLIGADIEDYVAIFGRYLSEHEQNSIILQYNKRLQEQIPKRCSTNIDLDFVIKDKTARIIKMIMENKKISLAEASKLWYNSKTKKETLDTKEYSFVSVTRCYDELEMELNNDPMWLMNPFD